MSLVRQAWTAFAVGAMIAAMVVLAGSAFVPADLRVTDVSIESTALSNTEANCEDVTIRVVNVRVTVEREAVSVDNPEWWEIGVAVQSTAIGDTKEQAFTLAPGERRVITLPFTEIREQSWAPFQTVEVKTQVSQGAAVAHETNRRVSLEPVSAGQNC